MERRTLNKVFVIFVAVNVVDAYLTVFGITRGVFYELWLSRHIMGFLGDWQGLIAMKSFAIMLGFALMQLGKRRPELFAGEGLAVLTGIIGIAVLYQAIAIFLAA